MSTSVPLEVLALAGVLLLLMAAIVSERLRSDVAALSALLLLVLIQKLPGMGTIVDEARIFRGFASDAVIALISVMIISAALTRSGILHQLADSLLRISRKPALGVGVLLGGLGMLSAGVQNAGATAMAIPVVRRYASRTGLNDNALLIPAGIMVLLGGCATLIGNSAMLLVNDLLPASSPRLSWWAPLPVGAVLVAVGIAYIGWRLKAAFHFQTRPSAGVRFRDVYRLEDDIRLVRWSPRDHRPTTVGQLEERYALRLVGLFQDSLVMAPLRDRVVVAGSFLALMGSPARHEVLRGDPDVSVDCRCPPLARAISSDHAGVVELVLPPGSRLADKTLREIRFRHRFGLTPLAVYRDQGLLPGDIRVDPLHTGDTVLAYMKWRDLDRLPAMEDAVLISPVPPRPAPEGVARRAALMLLLTVVLGLLLQPQLPVLMLLCALLMIVSGVLDIEEAYRAVSWQTVFMIAALFPLSDAMVDTGTSTGIATAAQWLLGPGASLVAVMLVCACAATLLALMVANVASVFILAPVAVELAQSYGHDPAMLVLLVAVCTANTFIMPNNQVNSLVAAAGGFRTADFLRSCWPLQLIFIAVSVAVFGWLYPAWIA